LIKSLETNKIQANNIDSRSVRIGCVTSHSLISKSANVRGTLISDIIDAYKTNITEQITAGEIDTGPVTASTLTGSIYASNMGSEMFVRLDFQFIQVGNAFITDVDGIGPQYPESGVQWVNANDGIGWMLQPGIYSIDFESSFTTAASIAVSKGPTIDSLVVDPNTTTGSTVANTWIHGRTIEVVTSILYVIITPLNADLTTSEIGTTGQYPFRVTFVRMA